MPERTKASVTLRPTRMPARALAVGLPPIMKRWRPKGVLASISAKTA